MLGFRLARLIARYLELTAGRAVAVLYDSKSGAILGWARDNRRHGFHVGTPSVNLQRGIPGDMSGSMKGCLILTSQPPETICLGMAALTQVAGIIHVGIGAGADRSYKPGNDLAPQGPRLPADPIKHDPKVAEWIDQCEKLLLANKALEFETLFANAPAGSRTPRDIQDAIALEMVPRIHVPKVPPTNAECWAVRDPMVDLFWMRVAKKLTGLVHLGANELKHDRQGHNIGCILVSADNQVLAWGVNTLKNSPTYHAETKCMWMFQHHHPDEKVPAGATLYTTLQSCLMCSATIKHACADHDVRVVYLDKDKVDGSALTRGGGAREAALGRILPRKIGSNPSTGEMLLAKARWDRLKRACQTPHEGSNLANEALRLPLRSDLEADMKKIADLQNPHIKKIMDASKLVVMAAKSGALMPAVTKAIMAGVQRAAQEGDVAACSALSAALSGAGIPELLAAEILKIFSHEIAAVRMFEAARTKSYERLGATRGKVLAVEQKAVKLDYTGGAPVLLQNPVTFEALDRMPVLTRPNEQDGDIRIRDLATQIHGLDVLLRMLREDGDYVRH